MKPFTFLFIFFCLISLRSEELLKNPCFSNGLKEWSLVGSTAYRERCLIKTENGSIQITRPSYEFPEKDYFGLQQDLIIKSGTEFNLYFSTRSTVPCFITVVVDEPETKERFFYDKVVVTRREKFHAFHIKIPSSQKANRKITLRFALKQFKGTLELSKISFREGEVPDRLTALPFSREWKLWLHVKAPQSFFTVPMTLEGSKGRTEPVKISPELTSSNCGNIDLAKLSAGEVWTEGSVAILFNEFTLDKSKRLNVGFSADWYMTLYMDGIKVYDTNGGIDGNGNAGAIRPETHKLILDLKKGRHVFAAVVRAGSGGWRFCWGPVSPFPPELIEYKANKEWKVMKLPDSPSVIPGSVLDFSGGVDAPAGKYGRMMINKNGLMAFEKHPDQAVRLMGFTGRLFPLRASKSNFKKEVKEWVGAIRRQGYNYFRCHGIDKWIMTGATKALEPDPEVMDRLDYIFSEFKKGGIYIQLVLFSYTLYEPPENFRKMHNSRNLNKLMMFFGRPWERERYKRAATMLLDHVNPYTGLAWKDDPMIGIIEFYNEQMIGLSSHRLKENLRKYPDDCRYLYKIWEKYLKEKYASVGPKDRPVELRDSMNNPSLPNASSSASYKKNFELFKIKHRQENNRWCRDTLRKLGWKGLMTQNAGGFMGGVTLWDAVSVKDDHSYFKHPSKFRSKGSRIKQESSIEEAAPNIRSLASSSFYGRPMGAGEYCYCFWNPFQRELPLTFTAYAAFQHFNFLVIHTQPVLNRYEWKNQALTIFRIAPNPVMRAGEILSHMFFKRGDVKPALKTIAIELPYKSLLKKDLYNKSLGAEQSMLGLVSKLSLNVIGRKAPPEVPKNNKPDLSLPLAGASDVSVHGWFVEDIYRTGNYPIAKLIRRMKNEGFLPEDNLTNPDKGIWQSDTGEITLEVRNKMITVVTPKTVAASFVDPVNNVKLGPLMILKTSTGATIGLTSADNRKLEDSKRFILIVNTRAVNTGLKLQKTPSGTLWDLGRGPVLLKTGTFRLSLDNLKTPPTACYALKFNGERQEKVSIKRMSNGHLYLGINTAALKKGPVTLFELVTE